MKSEASESYGRGLKFFRWQSGRAEGGYHIFPMLWKGFGPNFGVDCFLLRYPPGTEIAPHRDGLHTYKHLRHYRLNIKLWHTGKGGEFICENILWKFGPVVCFRPDINTHSVTKTEGYRILLSIGWKI